MRIATANNNRRRLVKRARRAAAFRRWADRAALAFFPEEKPWFRFDLASGPDRHVVCYGGGLGGGKSAVMRQLRERLAREPIEAPKTEVFFNELMTHGAAARLVELRDDARLHVETIHFPDLFKTMTGDE